MAGIPPDPPAGLVETAKAVGKPVADVVPAALLNRVTHILTEVIGPMAPLVLRAIANIMLGRFDAALKDLHDPAVGNQNDAQIWKALVAARQGRWPEAREEDGVNDPRVAGVEVCHAAAITGHPAADQARVGLTLIHI